MRTAILMVLVAASAAAQTGNELELARLRDYTNHRAGSYDRSGANDDGNWNNPIKAGD